MYKYFVSYNGNYSLRLGSSSENIFGSLFIETYNIICDRDSLEQAEDIVSDATGVDDIVILNFKKIK